MDLSLLLKTTITFHLFSLISHTMNYTTCHTHNCEQAKEFSFWTQKCGCDTIQLGSANETEFQQTQKIKNLIFQNSNHHCSSIVSESLRSKDILEGKNEVMEMIKDMPESSYELSFQDMVIEQHQMPLPETEHKQLENKQKKVKNKKENKSNKMLRVESMDSETFLLKMFFPTFDWMKKPKVQNGSIKQKDKDWRIKRFFTQDTQNSGSNNNKNRYNIN